MESLLRYTPSSTITFSITPGSKTSTYLTLTNVTDSPVAYKVKTTNVKRYCVCPNASIIEAGQTLDVELSQASFSAPPHDLEDCRDRFLLQAVQLDASLPTLFAEKNSSKVWDQAPTDSILKVRFTVNLELKELREGDARFAAPGAASAMPLPDTLFPTTAPASATNLVPSVAKPPLAPSMQQRDLNVTSAKPPTLAAPSLLPIASTQKSTVPPPPLPASSKSASKPSVVSPISVAPLAAPSAEPSTTLSTPMPEKESEPDYNSMEWARERALGVRPAPKVSPPALDRTAQQRVAVERAGELVRVINARQHDIDVIRKELAEARHKLSDAQMATRPAYDVRYEVNESARVPFAQICTMAIISGALLQLLV